MLRKFPTSPLSSCCKIPSGEHCQDTVQHFVFKALPTAWLLIICPGCLNLLFPTLTYWRSVWKKGLQSVYSIFLYSLMTYHQSIEYSGEHVLSPPCAGVNNAHRPRCSWSTHFLKWKFIRGLAFICSIPHHPSTGA